jgi:hypothetical protein
MSRVVARYGRLDLLCLDELGYVQIDPRGAELLFQIITEREERASVAIATNLPFSEWGTVFPGPRLVAAIVDRVTFNAHIMETGTKSYRLRTSKTAPRAKTSQLNRMGSSVSQRCRRTATPYQRVAEFSSKWRTRFSHLRGGSENHTVVVNIQVERCRGVELLQFGANGVVFLHGSRRVEINPSVTSRRMRSRIERSRNGALPA